MVARLLIVLLSTIITIAAIEAGLALLWPIPLAIESNMYFVADPHSGFRLQPNSLGWFQHDIPARANRHGHRSPDVTIERTPDTFRVLTVGDSFTVGANVREEDAWPRVLERLLRERTGRRVELINTAVGGWEPVQYAQGFAHDGARFGADVVVVGFFVGNDTYASTRPEDMLTAVGGRRVTRATAESSTIGLRVWLYQQFNLARLLLNRGPVVEEFTRNGCDDLSEQYVAIQSARLGNHLIASTERAARARANVEQIISVARLARVPVVVVLIPDENQLNRTLRARIVRDPALYDWDMPQTMLVPMFEAAHVVVVDLLDDFRRDARCLYLNDTHWTPEGHELAASLVAAPVSKMIR